MLKASPVFNQTNNGRCCICCCSSWNAGLLPRIRAPLQAAAPTCSRFSKGGLTISVLKSRCSRTGRSSVMLARSGLEDGGAPLSQNEVVDLLLVAVNTLLEPKNQRRLRELRKIRQTAKQMQSKISLQSSNVVQWSTSPAPIAAFQDLEEVKYLEGLEGTDGIDIRRNTSDQASPESTCSSNEETAGKFILNTLEMTELEQTQEQPMSIAESIISTAGSVESRGDSSLTTIRRLKVLDVHSYVHNALRESALRSWLHSRKIEE